MPLLEIADRLNKLHDKAIRAEREGTRQAEQHARRLSYYQEFGAKWFEEVSVDINQLISQFNETTGDHSKLQRAESEITDCDDIVVIFFIQNLKRHGANYPKCILSRHKSNPTCEVEIQNIKHPSKDHFEIAVKSLPEKPPKHGLAFSGFEVKVGSVTEKSVIVGDISWKDRSTGEINHEPEFHTERIKGSRLLNTGEFADYVLSSFAEKVLQSEA